MAIDFLMARSCTVSIEDDARTVEAGYAISQPSNAPTFATSNHTLLVSLLPFRYRTSSPAYADPARIVDSIRHSSDQVVRAGFYARRIFVEATGSSPTGRGQPELQEALRRQIGISAVLLLSWTSSGPGRVAMSGFTERQRTRGPALSANDR